MWASHLYHNSAPFQLSSGYGLFRRMTGVGSPPRDGSGGADGESASVWAPLPTSIVARPEIELEGYDEQNEVRATFTLTPTLILTQP